MYDEPTVLVVDDEDVVCKSCTRILEGQGFKVESSRDSRDGLRMALGKEYDSILLDIKMPALDGLAFLRELREAHRDVPVIMITGYAGVPTARAAMRLGAADYIPKPFTPDQLAESVGRSVARQEAVSAVPEKEAAHRPVAAPKEEATWTTSSQDYYFLDEAWLQRGQDGSVRVGAFLPRMEVMGIESVQLPSVGDVVCRGLPLAAVAAGGGSKRVIPSPVTGEVIEVHHGLAQCSTSPWEDPCHEAWIARIRPNHLDTDLKRLTIRKVVLAAKDETRGRQQRDQLTHLGCEVHTAVSAEGVLQALQDNQCRVLVMDAASFGDGGPEMVKRIDDSPAAVRTVVIADADSRWEEAYRARKVFYYSVEPFVDGEIIDILESVFVSAVGPAPAEAPSPFLPEWASRIQIINGYGETVSLLASGEVLLSHKGLGLQLRRTFLDENHPITTTLGAKEVTQMEILRELKQCDRLLILSTEDAGRLPGTLVRTSSKPVDAADDAGRTMTTFVVQPGLPEAGPLVFDARITAALAGYIAGEMTASVGVPRP